MSAEFQFNEACWKIRRQPAVASAARAEGEYLPRAPQSGLWLESDKSDKVFVAIPADKLPTEAELERVSIDQFIEWLQQGTDGHGR